MDNLVVVRLTVRAWFGRSNTKGVEREIEKTYNAEAGTVHATVQNLTEEYRRPLVKVVNSLRAYWYQITLPWDDGGWRVLPTETYVKVMDKVAEFNREFEDHVQKLLVNYETVRGQAKERLGDMFDESKFPELFVLQNRYAIRVDKGFVPSVEDIRLTSLDEAKREELQNEIETRYNDQISLAVQEVVNRLSEVVTDTIDRVSKKEQKGIKYTTLVKKIRNVTRSLPSLNITADPQITKVIGMIKDRLDDLDPDKLREHGHIRDKVKTDAKHILDEIELVGG